MINIINASSIFIMKKTMEEKEKNSVKKDSPPKSEPRNNLSFVVFLFRIIDSPKRRIKSNKKFIRNI